MIGGTGTEPQEHLLDRKLYLPRGKALGGSSSTNAMAYVRGNRTDYDDWAAAGNRGWSYEEALPYFKRSEFNADLSGPYHGGAGELHVEYPHRFRSPYSDAFIAACTAVGFARNDDTNGARQAGAGLLQFNIKDGKRHSGYTAFLKPAEGRPNLTVMTGVRTTEVLIEHDRAVGVRALTRVQSEVEFKAKREVILSAGAYASPQLLMLSGVGGREELSSCGIEGKGGPTRRREEFAGPPVRTHRVYRERQAGPEHHGEFAGPN